MTLQERLKKKKAHSDLLEKACEMAFAEGRYEFLPELSKAFYAALSEVPWSKESSPLDELDGLDKMFNVKYRYVDILKGKSIDYAIGILRKYAERGKFACCCFNGKMIFSDDLSEYE